MKIRKKISLFFINIILDGFIFFVCNSISSGQNLSFAELINEPSEFSIKPEELTITCQKASDNFYKTDSIFSFRSKKGYFPSLLHNFGEQVTAPLHFKTKQWLITGAAVGITTILISIDNDINDWARVQKQEYNWVNKSSPVITKIGGRWCEYLTAGTGLLSAAFKNQKGLETSLLATQAMITSGAWVNLIKLLTGRERPETDYPSGKSEGGKWYGPFAKFDRDLAIRKPGSSFDSFPSGHTAKVFSIAAVLASQYRDKKIVPVLCYSVASLVGISRMTEHRHWSSDVFAGALIGYLCGKQVVSHYNKTHQNNIPSMSSKSRNKAELAFIQYDNQIGISLKW